MGVSPVHLSSCLLDVSSDLDLINFCNILFQRDSSAKISVDVIARLAISYEGMNLTTGEVNLRGTMPSRLGGASLL